MTDSGATEPRTDRFRPTRCGVVNLWDYRDDEFVFADGRLVLRGPNGSGKTKALEVLFPFVLDGRIEPRRLNPFAGDERTMKANLLYRGQEAAYGYVWMEFRRAGNPAGEVVTIGAGLRAQRHHERVSRWYFVVDGQVGVDFSLIGEDDRPLTKRQLEAEVDHLPATMAERPLAHRTAVDARLFGLGIGRYEQMLTLLLTLRRPQLAKNLDPKGLSRALADGLRPLDEHLVDEAAHSFSDMENVQRTLSGLVQADAAAAAFLVGYTTYLRTHARAEADRLTVRLEAIDAARVSLTAALAARDRAAAARDAAQQHLSATRDRLQEATSRLDSLKASSAYRDREQLNRLADATADLGRAAKRDAQARDQAEADSAQRERTRAGTAAAYEDALSAVSRRAAELSEAARDAGIDWDTNDQVDDEHLDQRVAARITAREDDVAAVRVAMAGVAEAARERDLAQRRLDRAQERLEAVESALMAAQAAVVAERDRVQLVLADWISSRGPLLDSLAGAPRLADTVHAALVDSVDRAGESGSTPLSAVLDAQIADARQTRRDEVRRLGDTLNLLGDQLAAIRADRTRVAEEQDQAPPAFAARTGRRDGRVGAPLWALIDFAPGIDDDTAAAVEAALEAANLLDAWIGPDGSADPGESDAVLLPLPAEQRPRVSPLGTLLVAETDGALGISTIEAVLASIAVGEPSGSGPGAAPTIDRLGRFRQGLQLGAHRKAHAEYIGATARSRRRAQRLAALDRQIADVLAQVDATGAAIGALQAMLDAVDQARSALPTTGPLTTAIRRVERESAAARAVHGEVDNARSDLDQAIAAHHHRHHALLGLAAARSMPAEPDLVDGIAAAVALFGRAGAELGGARTTATERRRARDTAVEELIRARDRLAEAAEQAELSRTGHRAREEELRTLRAAVGVAVDELDGQIDRATAEHRDARTAERVAEQAHGDARDAAGERRGAAQGAVDSLANAVVEAQRDCLRLRPYCRPDVADVLRLSTTPAWPTAREQWPDPTALVATATDALPADADHIIDALPAAVTTLLREVLAATGDLRPNESSLKSSRTRVAASLTLLQDQLASAGHDFRPDWEPVEDVIVVKVSDEQGYTSIGDFARRIAAARREQEALLSESEQRILEDALLGRLAQQIHERTTEARDLVAEMNREMRGRRMSSGATVGISWAQADNLDPAQREVARLLEREASALSVDELAIMRAHFAGRIKDLRAQREDRPYPDILAEALDYRGWRTFVLTLVGPDGQEDRLTQARHSTLSGGEQSVSLHLPLFAAAHVMLSSAEPHCPRLLALDEAFAGIDDAGRSELLGLTTQFDLDLFMTGYDLWATYPTVPGCAHHDLAHSALEHAVSSLLLVWDGSEILSDAGITEAGDDLAAALGSPGSRRRPSDGSGLLGPD